MATPEMFCIPTLKTSILANYFAGILFSKFQFR